ncbi:MAG: PAS domain S-box protein [Deltaproteobacteria bacterium]|nr:PAS domain S-box protein [Deltaproteobacteria bacterium]
MFQRFIQRLQGISLKWKLLIPFLFFAFTGTSTLTVIGLTSQQRLIKQEERKMLLLHYQIFLNELERKGEQAIALASVVAEDKEVQQLLAERDRSGLYQHIIHTYVRLKLDYDISQFHFHVPPGVSFLRLHEPTLYGDVLYPYRGTIREALEKRGAVWGLEMGETGFGIRGVVPVFLGPSIVGTVEIGHSFGRTFLLGLHQRWGIDLALYVPGGDHAFESMASATGEESGRIFSEPARAVGEQDEPLILVAPPGLPDRAILQSPVRDYEGNLAAVLEVSADRSSIRHRLARTRNLMIAVGALGITISFLLTYLVAILFIRPIKAIVRGAQEIAEERRESYLEPGFGDEIGTLKKALNRMLAALMERRVQLEEYAKNLEKRVQERTADLVASEEKFRTLVENVPLIVYRLLEDGTTEFINTYLTESLGYDIDEAVGDKDFWFEKILGRDQEAYRELFETCFQKGKEFRIERVVRDKDGRPLVFLDHAIPAADEEGEVHWIDGIMMDITGLKQLQERSLRTEEIRLLSEISARMAHEIRNPLSTAGGFARRLRDALPEDDRNRRTAEIIVQEVARMETFLEILLSSIRRVDLHITEVDLNGILRFWAGRMEHLAGSKNVRIRKDLDDRLPAIHGDEDRLNQALESLIKHAIVSMPPGDTLEVGSRAEGDHVILWLTFHGDRVSDDDLEQFFFPHLEQNPEESVLDLPLSKIIIHRHGGRVEVSRDQDLLVTEIELPLRPVAEFLE